MVSLMLLNVHCLLALITLWHFPLWIFIEGMDALPRAPSPGVSPKTPSCEWNSCRLYLWPSLQTRPWLRSLFSWGGQGLIETGLQKLHPLPSKYKWKTQFACQSSVIRPRWALIWAHSCLASSHLHTGSLTLDRFLLNKSCAPKWQ